jgi:hypothetical protein
MSRDSYLCLSCGLVIAGDCPHKKNARDIGERVPCIPDTIERDEIERLRACVAELEKERDDALASAASARVFASDATVHLRARVAELEAKLAQAEDEFGEYR